MISGKPYTLRTLYAEGRKHLTALPPGCPPEKEALLLLEHTTGCGRVELGLQPDRVMESEQAQSYLHAVARRLAGEPLQYILGSWEFYGLPFSVGDGVLIPRPETELLVDLALQKGSSQPLQMLDLCSGSGCVALACAHHRPNWQVTALELSPIAFGYLQRNLARLGLSNVTAVQGDAMQPRAALPPVAYGLITANPPYIPTAELPGLAPEVRREPAMALDGGPDGLDFYRAFATLYLPLLQPGAWLLLELGYTQGQAVAALLQQAGFTQIELHNDLSGIARVVAGRKPVTLNGA